MGQVSHRNRGALEYATKYYLTDSKLTSGDRLALIEHLQSTQRMSTALVISPAFVVGGAAGLVGSRVFKSGVYKYALSSITGFGCFLLASKPIERAVFDYKLSQLKRDGFDLYYDALNFYSHVPIRQQIQYHQSVLQNPELRAKDPRELGEGKFDGFMNALREKRGNK